MKPAPVMLLLTACATATPRHQLLSADAVARDERYPCVLHDPAEWPENFMVRQTIEVGGRAVEAVVQKQANTLLIIGLGPMNTRGFTITQRGQAVEIVQAESVELPFPAQFILVDVHRVFWKKLPQGRRAGELDGEHVEEIWDGGELRTRIFTRPGSSLKGAVRVEYGAGCRAERCQPDMVTVTNEWLGYTIAIHDQAFETLE